jgi:hypothetical protein
LVVNQWQLIKIATKHQLTDILRVAKRMRCASPPGNLELQQAKIIQTYIHLKGLSIHNLFDLLIQYFFVYQINSLSNLH